MSSIMPYSGRAALAQAVLAMPIHCAIGDGGPNWDPANPPQLDYEATGLIHEVGRMVLHRGLFVLPDSGGELELPGGQRFAISVTPTRFVYVEFLFQYNDGVEATAREIGIFVGTVVAEGVPATKRFLFPSEVANPGTLLILIHPGIGSSFNPQTKGRFEQVITV